MTWQEQVVTWSYWKIRGGKRPKGIPTSIPDDSAPGDNWWEFLSWAKWVMNHRLGPRPKNVRKQIPQKWWPAKAALEKKLKGTPIPGPVNPPPVTNPFPTVWGQTRGIPGLYFYSAQNAPHGMVSAAKANNLWVALLTHEIAEKTEEQCPPWLVKALKDAGVPIIATGWVDPNYSLDAQAAVIEEIMGTGNFVEYMANAEFPWAWTHTPGVDPTPGFKASAKFAPMVREAIGPRMALSLSIMWGQIIHLRPWLEAGLFKVSPQCYVNEFAHTVPKEAVKRLALAQGDLPNGIPAHMVEPTYGTYGSFQTGMGNYTHLHNEARPLGCGAGSVWAAEFVPVSQYPIVAGFRKGY